MGSISGTALLLRLRAAGGLVAGTQIAERKGTAEWTSGDLRYRISLKEGPDGARWWVSVGDRQLGRSFHEGGVLASIPIRPAPEQAPLPWPTADDEVVPFLRELHARLVPAVGFVADRRDLCALLISPGDVRRGELVADLRAGYVERVLRAFVVARHAGDHEAAAVAHAILVSPPAGAPTEGITSLLDQARIWADQWSYQSGLAIEVPDTVGAVVSATADHAPTPAPTFWERVG
ncbi:MAG: hypothetical protein R2702_08860 [Acidimicrobiales bacterium]